MDEISAAHPLLTQALDSENATTSRLLPNARCPMMRISGVTISWFDFFIFIVLLLGLLRGRKRGMSEELLDLVQCLAMVALGAILYRPIGDFAANYTHMTVLVAYIASYLF